MRILICGDRNWVDQDTITKALKLWNPTVVIEGECRGADILGRESAKQLGIPFIPYPAYWKKIGRGAGPIRNQQMLDEGHPDLVLAFHNDIEHSKGTKDMMTRAKLAGIKTILYSTGDL